MKAAQIALAALVGILIAAGCTMFIVDEKVPAWVFTGFGLFGFFTLLAMIVSDSRQLPPPRP